MATLRDHCSLLQTSVHDKFLGFTTGFHELQVLVTKKGKIVTVYDVESLNALKSWTCRPSEVFSAAASVHANGHYVAVVNSKVIRIWADDELNLDSGQKVTVSTPIHAVVGERNREVVVIFKNGHACTLNKVLHNPAEERNGALAPAENIKQWRVEYIQNSIIIGLIVSTEQETNDLLFVTLDSNGISQKTQRWSLEREGYTIKAVGILRCERPTLVTVSSDSSLHVFEPAVEKELDSSWHQLKSVRAQPEVRFVDVIRLDDYHIALVSTNTDIQGFVLTIFDTKYQVEKASKTLTGFTYRKAFLCSKLLLLLCKEAVLVVPFELQPATLSAVVGSLASTKTATRCQRYQVDLALSWVPIVDSGSKEVSKSANERHDSANYMSALLHTLPPEVKSATKKLFSEGKSTSFVCRNVFDALLESKKVDSLCSAIQAFQDIPEDIIVRLLQFFLSLNINGVSSKKLNSDFHQSVKKEAISEVLDLKSTMINTLLCFPFNDVFLQEYIRTVPFQDVKMLLSHLCRCLDSPPDVNEKLLSPPKVVDWICVILDSCVLNMTLSSDEELVGLFNHLNTSIRNQYSYLEDLEKLELAVDQLKLKNETTVSDSGSPYAIQILRIP